MTPAATRRLLALALAVTAILGAASALDPDELLEPQRAFQVAARPIDARNVEIGFRIARGYYMYRDRFRFETEAGEVLADAALPPGLVKHDQFFGRTQTYRDHVRIRIPLSEEAYAKRRVKLKVISQGCSDKGVCYVPQEQWVDVRLDSDAPGRSP